MEIDINQYCQFCKAWKLAAIYIPRHPVILTDWGVRSPPKRTVFRFHYYSQEVFGCLEKYVR